MNLKLLAEHLDIEEEQCLEFLSLIKETTASELRNLEAALKMKEASVTERMAHSIKGAAGILGLTEIHDTAKRIETAARMNRLEEAKDELQTLRRELKALFEAYEWEK